MTLSRRDFLQGAAVGSLTGTAPALRDIAARKNILFGGMVMASEISGSPDYAELIRSECAIITPGIEAKWGYTEPAEAAFRFAPLDSILHFASAAGLRVHMHNLVWAVGLPGWTTTALRAGRGAEILARHINAVAGRYRGRVHSWDVVNEPVDPRWPADADGLCTTPWWHGLGPAYVADAFAIAAQADPGAQLMLNDDDLEYDTPDHEKKRAQYLRLVEKWLRSGVKLQAFGLETHLKPWLPLAEKPYRRFLRELAGFGLKLRITEFDVNDRMLPADVAARDAAVATVAKRFLDIALDEAALDTVIVWGLSDRSSWMVKDPEGRRPDGMPPRPCPYDRELGAKPLRAAIAAALAAAPARPA